MRGGEGIVAKKEKLVPVTAMVSPATKEELYALAAEAHRATVSSLIDAAIQQYLRSEKKAQPAHETPLMHHELVGA